MSFGRCLIGSGLVRGYYVKVVHDVRLSGHRGIDQVAVDRGGNRFVLLQQRLAHRLVLLLQPLDFRRARVVVCQLRGRQGREHDGQEVVQRQEQGVLPLSREVAREHRVAVGVGQEWQRKPLLPLRLALELRRHLLKELLELVVALGLDAVDDVQLVNPGLEATDGTRMNWIQPPEKPGAQMLPQITKAAEVMVGDQAQDLIYDSVKCFRSKPDPLSVIVKLPVGSESLFLFCFGLSIERFQCGCETPKQKVLPH